MQRILAATDLSSRGDHAVARAMELARRFGAELVLLHAVDDELPAPLRERQLADARAAMEDRVEPYRAAGGSVRVRAESGLDFQVIADVAKAEAADLVVAGPHRRSILRDLFFGTTVERLLRLGSFPVLVAFGGEPKPYATVLAAVDLVEESEFVLEMAARLAAPGRCHLMHVRIDPVDVQLSSFGSNPDVRIDYRRDVEAKVHEILARLTHAAKVEPMRPHVRHGGPVAASIEASARELGADLVVMGTTTQGRSMFQRWLHASRAEQALIEGSIDVLCVPLGTTTPIPDAPTIP